MDTVCRACSQEAAEYELIDLFGGSGYLATIFGQCMSLEIDIDDGLPNHLCADCNAKLIGFHKFRSSCHKWDSHFRPAPQMVDIKCESEPKYVSTTEMDEITSDVVDKPNDGDEHELIELVEVDDEMLGSSGDHLVKTEEDPASSDCYEERLDDDADAEHSNGHDFDDKLPITNVLETESDVCLCDICNQRCSTYALLVEHMRTHSQKKPECPECGKTFATETTLSNHVRYAHDAARKPFACAVPHCNKAYVLQQSLTKHMRDAHEGSSSGDETKPEKRSSSHRPRGCVCDQCGKIFKTMSALNKHTFVHTGQQPFACTYCPKRYVTKHKLKEHTMRHEGIKNHVCPVCGIRKTTAHELKVHTNFHTREKLWSCDQCVMVFTSVGNLTRHIRIVHCGIKAYACEFCDRSFGKNETLKHHVMTHTGERPHQCPVCAKRFIQSIALQTHMKIHQKQAAAEAAANNVPVDYLDAK